MNKSDYDKYYKKGGTYVIPVEIFNELFDELERLSFNYEQALEDLVKKENIIKEVREKIHDIWFKIDFTNMTSMSYVTIKLDTTSQGNELLEILDKEVN